MSNSHAVPSAPVEKKVKAATGGAFLVSAAIAVLNSLVGDSQLLGTLPALAQSAIILFAPPLVTFISGWKAAHTPRTEI